MRRFLFRCIAAAIFSGGLFAQDPELRVGIPRLYPPFIIQTSPTTLSGFDIDMMNFVCAKIKRTCKFNQKKYGELFPALNANQLDVAVGALVITLENAKKVIFSIPYLPSRYQLVTKAPNTLPPYSLAALSGKTFSISEGSGFSSEILKLGVQTPKFNQFENRIDAVQSLINNKNVDFTVLDQPAALYWVANSNNSLQTYGPPIQYGVGLGVAINPNQVELAKQINQALELFYSSGTFEQYYNMYIYIQAQSNPSE